MFFVERRNEIVLVETKHLGEELSVGQEKLLRNFSTKPGCCSIVLWGPRSEPQEMRICQGGEWQKKRRVSRDGVYKLAKRWCDFANGKIDDPCNYD